MNDELKPCPFCGGTKIVHYGPDRTPNFADTHYVRCVTCGAAGPLGGDVEANWNERPSSIDIEGIAREIAEDLRNHDLHDCASMDIAFCAAIPRIAAILRRSLTPSDTEEMKS